MVHGLLVIGPAPISHELSSIGAGSALRYEIVEWIPPQADLRYGNTPAGGSLRQAQDRLC